MCWARRPTARPCCSIVRGRRIRSGMRSRGPCRNRSWPSRSTCMRSTRPGSHGTSVSPDGSTSSCRPASSRSRACCHASGHRADQEGRCEDVRPTRRRGGRAQSRRGRSRPRRTGPGRGSRGGDRHPGAAAARPADAPEFVLAVTAEMLAGRGDALPVSALPVDGTYPSGTTAYEKRNISELVAVWDADTCIQCGNCSFVCPHSVIRSRYYDQSNLSRAHRTGSLRPLWMPWACLTPATRCRSTSRTARAARSASRRARSSRRATRSERRSTSRRASRWS